MIHRFLTNPKVIIGLIIIGVFTLVALLGKPFSTHVLDRSPQTIFPEATGIAPT